MVHWFEGSVGNRTYCYDNTDKRARCHKERALENARLNKEKADLEKENEAMQAKLRAYESMLANQGSPPLKVEVPRPEKPRSLKTWSLTVVPRGRCRSALLAPLLRVGAEGVGAMPLGVPPLAGMVPLAGTLTWDKM